MFVYTGNGTCRLIGAVPGDPGINIEHRWVQGPLGQHLNEYAAEYYTSQHAKHHFKVSGKREREKKNKTEQKNIIVALKLHNE